MATGNHLANNTVSNGGGSGIEVLGVANQLVTANVIRGFKRHGVHVSGATGRTVIIDNDVEGNGFGGILAEDSARIAIEGNRCDGNGGGPGVSKSTSAGIRVIGSSNGPRQTVMRGNQCRGERAQSWGLVLEGHVGETVLDGNRLDDNLLGGMRQALASGSLHAVPWKRIPVSVGMAPIDVEHGLSYVPIGYAITMRSRGSVWVSGFPDDHTVRLQADRQGCVADLVVG